MQPIDFWIEYGSTYTYLSVARIGRLATQAGVELRWQPFLVMPIMAELGMTQGPFLPYPAKTAYMWRDIGRRAAKYGLSPKLPAPYPIADLPLANQVALLGMAEGWGRDYVAESYRLWFDEGVPAGAEPNLSNSLRAAGQDPPPRATRHG